MIRDGTLDDVPNLLSMGERFFSVAHIQGTYDADSVAATLNTLITSPGGILLVNGDVSGAIGGMVYPLYYNHAIKTAQEFFWWCEKSGDGLGLLKAMEEKAKDMGAQSLTMVHLTNLMPERVAGIYEKRGYSKGETHYLRIF